MRKLSQKEAYAVGIVNFAIFAVALIVCGVLSNWVGEWILWLWFVVGIGYNAWCYWGHSVLTYLFIGIALATVVLFNFSGAFNVAN